MTHLEALAQDLWEIHPISWVDGAVPMRLPEARVRTPLIEASPDRALLRLPSIGRFLVPVGGPVVVARAPGAGAADVDCFVGGPVRALAALLAGRFTLRATAVAWGGRAVVLAGASGAGKSALGAVLAERGCPVVADGVVEIDGPVVIPTSDELQLWPDVTSWLDLAPAAARLVRPGLGKWAFRWPAAAGALPLGAIVVLRVDRRQPETPLTFEERRGPAKLPLVASTVWHAPLIGPLGRAGDNFGWLSAVAAAAPVFVAARPVGPVDAILPRLSGALREALAGRWPT